MRRNAVCISTQVPFQQPMTIYQSQTVIVSQKQGPHAWICKPFQISVCVYIITMLHSNLCTTLAFNANLEGDRYSSRTE